jgi:hypothetical protein
MNEFLKERLLRQLSTLSDEKVYQVLDYAEFLGSKYAEQKPAPPNVFQRFAEGVEDTMRAGKMSASTVAQTMGFLSQAMGVLNGVAAAGKSVASDVAGAAGKVVNAAVSVPAAPPSVPASTPPAAPTDAVPPAADGKGPLPPGAG